jgi:hypothetical protein
LTHESFTFRYRNVNAGSPDLSPGGEGAGRTRRRYTIHLELEASSDEDGPCVPLWSIEDEDGAIAENGFARNLAGLFGTATALLQEDFEASDPEPTEPLRRPTHLIQSRLRLIEQAPLTWTPVAFTRAFVTVAKEAIFKAQDEMHRWAQSQRTAKVDRLLGKVRDDLEYIDRATCRAQEDEEA